MFLCDYLWKEHTFGLSFKNWLTLKFTSNKVDHWLELIGLFWNYKFIDESVYTEKRLKIQEVNM